MRNRTFIPQTPPSEDEWRGDRQIVKPTRKGRFRRQRYGLFLKKKIGPHFPTKPDMFSNKNETKL